MDVRHLRHFLAVAETLNYTRAAERLMMAASPLSRSIQQLELEVGGLLFSRGTRKVELTQLGMALVPQAERTIADMDALARDMRRRVSGYTELHLGTRSVPPELLRAVIDDVIKAADPDTAVHIDPDDSFVQMDRILSGRLTLGLLARRDEDRRLDYIPVLQEAAGIALPDLPEFSELTEVHPSDLRGLRLLLQPGTDSGSPELEAIKNAVLDVVPIESNIIGGLSAILAEGGYCCLTLANPTAPWHKYLAGNGVIVRPLSWDMPKVVTYLCWRIDRDKPDDLGPILELARERFRVPLDL